MAANFLYDWACVGVHFLDLPGRPVRSLDSLDLAHIRREAQLAISCDGILNDESALHLRATGFDWQLELFVHLLELALEGGLLFTIFS